MIPTGGGNGGRTTPPVAVGGIGSEVGEAECSDLATLLENSAALLRKMHRNVEAAELEARAEAAQSKPR